MLSGFFKHQLSIADCCAAFANGTGLTPRLPLAVMRRLSNLGVMQRFTSPVLYRFHGGFSSLHWTANINKLIPVTNFVDDFPILDVLQTAQCQYAGVN